MNPGLSNGFYVVPDAKERKVMVTSPNCSEAEVSLEAAGVVGGLTALGQLQFWAKRAIVSHMASCALFEYASLLPDYPSIVTLIVDHDNGLSPCPTSEGLLFACDDQVRLMAGYGLMTIPAHPCPTCHSAIIAPILVSRKDAAAALGISLRGLAYLVRSKRLAHRRTGGRVLIPVAALHEFASQDHDDLILLDAA